jgi:hypothetical protein
MTQSNSVIFGSPDGVAFTLAKPLGARPVHWNPATHPGVPSVLAKDGVLIYVVEAEVATICDQTTSYKMTMTGLCNALNRFRPSRAVLITSVCPELPSQNDWKSREIETFLESLRTAEQEFRTSCQGTRPGLIVRTGFVKTPYLLRNRYVNPLFSTFIGDSESYQEPHRIVEFINQWIVRDLPSGVERVTITD